MTMITSSAEVDWWEPNVSDRLVHLISHEYIHVQQPAWQNDESGNSPKLTLLIASLSEGVAEFVGELISGSVGEVHLQRWLAGCDRRIAGFPESGGRYGHLSLARERSRHGAKAG